MDPSVGVTQGVHVKRWVLVPDTVVAKAVAVAVGVPSLESLVAHFKEHGELLSAAKVEFAIATAVGESLIYGTAAHEEASLALLAQIGETHDPAKNQLEVSDGE